MSAWLEAKVVDKRVWTPSLFSLRVQSPALSFEAGQFVRIALDIDGERVARPFSFVNPPQDPVLEFYGVEVPEGPLSPRLARLKPGDALWVADNPSGFLVLRELPDAPMLWLVSTGAGIAPFLSILMTEACWKRFGRVVLVHGVRHAAELTYRELIERVRIERKASFVYVPFVSREKAPDALHGRVPDALRDGRLEAAAGPLVPDAQFMLCGNPQMLRDMTSVLIERGFRKHRRRAPGHISVESFW
jgi:ferredoxin/flavodoxin---NADP+ reductase